MSSNRVLQQKRAVLPAHCESDELPNTLTEVVDHYATLKEDYDHLKSRYEKLSQSHELLKQLTLSHGQHPFVLVLISGDHYIFNDDLVSDGAEGGERAAQLLDDVVKASLQDKGLGHCHIMVRVYADVVSLTKHLRRLQLVNRKKSFVQFTSNFTATREMFDFVDTGEQRQSPIPKIRATFRHFVENSQCKHIYFAGCHTPRHIKELQSYEADRERITLVGHHAFNKKCHKLDLPIEEFPGIFRATPFYAEREDQAPASPSPEPTSPLRKTASPAQETAPNTQERDATSDDTGTEICRYFQHGICRWGADCSYLHILIDDHGRPVTLTDNTSITERSGHIPINSDGHRLDPYQPLSSSIDWKAYQQRNSRKKLCNRHHILGHCHVGKLCTFDHLPAAPGVLDAHWHVVHRIPCPKKGSCRRTECFLGHVCAFHGCQRGPRCRFDEDQHGVDMTVAKYVYGARKATTNENDGASTKNEQTAADVEKPITEKIVSCKAAIDERIGQENPKPGAAKKDENEHQQFLHARRIRRQADPSKFRPKKADAKLKRQEREAIEEDVHREPEHPGSEAEDSDEGTKTTFSTSIG